MYSSQSSKNIFPMIIFPHFQHGLRSHRVWRKFELQMLFPLPPLSLGGFGCAEQGDLVWLGLALLGNTGEKPFSGSRYSVTFAVLKKALWVRLSFCCSTWEMFWMKIVAEFFESPMLLFFKNWCWSIGSIYNTGVRTSLSSPISDAPSMLTKTKQI